MNSSISESLLYLSIINFLSVYFQMLEKLVNVL